MISVSSWNREYLFRFLVWCQFERKRWKRWCLSSWLVCLLSFCSSLPPFSGQREGESLCESRDCIFFPSQSLWVYFMLSSHPCLDLIISRCNSRRLILCSCHRDNEVEDSRGTCIRMHLVSNGRERDPLLLSFCLTVWFVCPSREEQGTEKRNKRQGYFCISWEWMARTPVLLWMPLSFPPKKCQAPWVSPWNSLSNFMQMLLLYHRPGSLL